MIKAVLFDMDGTVFDTEKVYRTAWLEAGKRFGYEPHYDLVVNNVTGRNHHDIGTFFKELMGDDFAYEEMMDYKNRVIGEIIEKDGLKCKPGVPQVFDELHKMGVLCAIASSTNPIRVEKFLTESGLKDKFDLILAGGSVEHSKPAPDIFLLAAEKLGVAPEECIVAEDSSAGVEAGCAAGMRVCFVYDLMELSPETAGMPWKCPKTLAELPDLIRNI